VSVVLGISSAAATAQGNPQLRDGFWIGFGLGAGSMGCTDCDSRESAATGSFRIGGTLNQKVLLGSQVDVWTKTVDGGTLSFSNVTAALYYYPIETEGLYFMGGVGVASRRFAMGSLSVQSDGPGLTLGAGYDWRVGQHFALTPYVTLVGGHFRTDGISETVNMVHFGLGFTWP
jgi:hypothetical protein